MLWDACTKLAAHLTYKGNYHRAALAYLPSLLCLVSAEFLLYQRLLPCFIPFQALPMAAYLTVPVLGLSCDTIDFEICLVNQTRSEAVLVMNTSGCRSYWTALLGKRNREVDISHSVKAAPMLGSCIVRTSSYFLTKSQNLFNYRILSAKKKWELIVLMVHQNDNEGHTFANCSVFSKQFWINQ